MFQLLVLHLYRSGTLHGISHVCSMTLRADLKYWGIDKLLLSSCCAVKHYPEIETMRKEYKNSKKVLEREELKRTEENFGVSWIARCRTVIWNLTEYPETSMAARVMYTITLFTR